MIRALRFDGATVRTGLSEDEIADALKDPSVTLWVDLPPGEPERKLLKDVFGFHQLAIEDCFNRRTETPKVDDYGEYLFIVAQTVTYFLRTEQLDLTEVDIFLGSNYVVTSRQTEVPSVDDLFHRACENHHLLNRGSDFLAHTILDDIVDQMMPAVEAMDEQIDDLEQRIIEKPDKGLLPEVMVLKRNVLRLRRSILPERDMVNRISRGEFSTLIRSEALIFFRDVYDHIVRVEEMLDGLRDIADGAMSSYLSALNNRMNEVMKTLSVVTVIFLPLTLIASIYGTNLDYSPFGIDFQYGFFLMIAGMAAIAGALIVFFRKRGWF
jgi:magnesium transporter